LPSGGNDCLIAQAPFWFCEDYGGEGCQVFFNPFGGELGFDLFGGGVSHDFDPLVSG
jgi:hypothetical protein